LLPLRLVHPVHGAEVDGLGQVRDLDGLSLLHVGDGAGDAQHARVGPGREPEAAHGLLQELVLALAHRAPALQKRALEVGVQPDAGVLVPLGLDGPDLDDACAHGGRVAAAARGLQVLVGHGGHLHLQVDAVHERAGDARAVAVDGKGLAGADVAVVGQVAAGAGVHGRHEHEVRRIGQGLGRAGDRHPAVFQGLAQHLQHVLLELRQLV